MPNTTATSGFTITNWKPIEGRSTLRAWFSMELPSGILLHGWAFHETAESRWVSPPAKEYKGKWSPLLEIPDDAKRVKFQDQAIAAVDAWLEEKG